MSSYRDVPAVVRSIWCAFLLLFTLTSLDARWTLDGTGGRMGKSYATHSTSNGATVCHHTRLDGAEMPLSTFRGSTPSHTPPPQQQEYPHTRASLHILRICTGEWIQP